MTEVVIHHVSDIHIGSDHYAPKVTPIGEQLDPSFAFRFRSYVEFLERSEERLPDLVVLSGDFVSRGQNKDEFETARELTERLIKAVNRDRESSAFRVCLVPGNHDLDWSRDTYEEKIENYTRTFARLKDRAIVHEVSERSDFVIPGTNILIYLLNSCSLGGKIKSGFAPIERALVDSGLDGNAIEKAVHLLRTEQRIDPGYITNFELKEMLRRAASYPDHLKIAVVHHNLSSAPSDYIDQFSAIINAGEFKEYLRDARFDLVLHGHQHYPYCTYEQIVDAVSSGDLDERVNWRTHRHSQGIHILGAPSLGTSYADPTAPRWFQIKIASTNDAAGGIPSTLVNVKEARPHPTSNFQLRPAYRFSISKPLSAKLGLLHEHLGRSELPTPPTEYEVRSAVVDLLAPILKLQARLDDWDFGDSLSWQGRFLEGLNSYETVFGTDLLGPTGWMNPNYLAYIHKQFEQKKLRRKAIKEPCIALCDAMDRTDWGTLKERKGATRGVQIARILLWGDAEINDDFGRWVLRMVDAMHRLHDVPVFVLDPSASGLGDDDRRYEFVFVASSGATNSNCYVYDTRNPNENTERVTDNLAEAYLDRFSNLLAQPELKSIKQVLSQGAPR